MPVAGEFRKRAAVLAFGGGREFDIDQRLDAAGLRRHDRDALTEIDRLLDRMGDEDDGRAGAPPEAQEAFSVNQDRAGGQSMTTYS